MSWWHCPTCKSAVSFPEYCSGCSKCWDCVRQCTSDRCIACCEDSVLQMKCIWETQFKPQIRMLLDMKHGQYLALIAICHACEHAYKTLVCNRRDVMQDALESTFRLHDFLAHASDRKDFDITEEPFKHWGKTRAHVLREVLFNPTKHEGRPNKGTGLLFDPNAAISSHITTMTPEEHAILEAGGTVNLDVSNRIENAYYYIPNLTNGVDEAYSAFLSNGRAHEWFSPSTCGDDCETCRKEMMIMGAHVKSKPAAEEDRIRRQVRTDRATGRIYLSARDSPLSIGFGPDPSPLYEGNLSPRLAQLCESVVRDLQQKYREVRNENDKYNELTPVMEIVLPNGDLHTYS